MSTEVGGNRLSFEFIAGEGSSLVGVGKL